MRIPIAATLGFALMLSLGGGGHAAPPETVRFDETAPFVAVLEDCGSEPVLVTATIRVWGMTRSGEGEARMQLHSRMEGDGVGLLTGSSYRALGHELSDIRYAPPALDTHLVLDVKLVGKGRAPNSTFSVRFKMTIRDGVPVLQQDRAGCRISG